MNKAEQKNLLKARAVPYLISKGMQRAQAEHHFEVLWDIDPDVVRVETKIGLHRQPTPIA